MVFILPAMPPTRLMAYVLPSFPLSELPAFKRAFEHGTCAPFDPMLELVIAHAPADWAGQTYEYMRQKVNDSGRDGDESFVVLDARAAGGRDGVVEYVSSFADDAQVEDGEAKSTSVVWRIPVKTDCLALSHVGYEEANSSIPEDLCNLDVELPVDVNYEVHGADDNGGLDMDDERYSKIAQVIAEPGEYEESTDLELREANFPIPDRVVRLREGLNESIGLENEWGIVHNENATTIELPDGTEKHFPEGSIELDLHFNPEFNWPAYQWPEGSL
ncbi:hypothetical protein F4808DRAFT_419912 [Astrocystis sublimbata]|nr:hypothetical protein F4808DRAFT_419912 [Astrocystis sublimbata]